MPELRSTTLLTAASTVAEIVDDLPEGATLGAVIIVYEVEWLHDEDGDRATSVHYRCSDGRHWFQRGLLAAGMDATRQ